MGFRFHGFGFYSWNRITENRITVHSWPATDWVNPKTRIPGKKKLAPNGASFCFLIGDCLEN